MKKLLLYFSVAAVSLFFSGCAEPVVFAEVFQMNKESKLYTKYNIWYDDPQDINSLNIQRGSFLPVGSEIIPIGTTEFGSKIKFKDASGQEYVIKFSENHRLCTMRDFMTYTFTTEPREKLLEGINEKVKNRILRGEVIPGMSQKEVLLTYGPPPKSRTPDLRKESWFYWVTPAQTIRVVFRGDKVRNILVPTDI